MGSSTGSNDSDSNHEQQEQQDQQQQQQSNEKASLVEATSTPVQTTRGLLDISSTHSDTPNSVMDEFQILYKMTAREAANACSSTAIPVISPSIAKKKNDKDVKEGRLRSLMASVTEKSESALQISTSKLQEIDDDVDDEGGDISLRKRCVSFRQDEAEIIPTTSAAKSLLAALAADDGTEEEEEYEDDDSNDKETDNADCATLPARIDTKKSKTTSLQEFIVVNEDDAISEITDNHTIGSSRSTMTMGSAGTLKSNDPRLLDILRTPATQSNVVVPPDFPEEQQPMFQIKRSAAVAGVIVEEGSEMGSATDISLGSEYHDYLKNGSNSGGGGGMMTMASQLLYSESSSSSSRRQSSFSTHETSSENNTQEPAMGYAPIMSSASDTSGSNNNHNSSNNHNDHSWKGVTMGSSIVSSSISGGNTSEEHTTSAVSVPSSDTIETASQGESLTTITTAPDLAAQNAMYDSSDRAVASSVASTTEGGSFETRQAYDPSDGTSPAGGPRTTTTAAINRMMMIPPSHGDDTSSDAGGTIAASDTSAVFKVLPSTTNSNAVSPSPSFPTSNGTVASFQPSDPSRDTVISATDAVAPSLLSVNDTIVTGTETYVNHEMVVGEPTRKISALTMDSPSVDRLLNHTMTTAPTRKISALTVDTHAVDMHMHQHFSGQEVAIGIPVGSPEASEEFQTPTIPAAIPITLQTGSSPSTTTASTNSSPLAILQQEVSSTEPVVTVATVGTNASSTTTRSSKRTKKKKSSKKKLNKKAAAEVAAAAATAIKTAEPVDISGNSDYSAPLRGAEIQNSFPDLYDIDAPALSASRATAGDYGQKLARSKYGKAKKATVESRKAYSDTTVISRELQLKLSGVTDQSRKIRSDPSFQYEASTKSIFFDGSGNLVSSNKAGDDRRSVKKIQQADDRLSGKFQEAVDRLSAKKIQQADDRLSAKKIQQADERLSAKKIDVEDRGKVIQNENASSPVASSWVARNTGPSNVVSLPRDPYVESGGVPHHSGTYANPLGRDGTDVPGRSVPQGQQQRQALLVDANDVETGSACYDQVFIVEGNSEEFRSYCNDDRSLAGVAPTPMKSRRVFWAVVTVLILGGLAIVIGALTALGKNNRNGANGGLGTISPSASPNGPPFPEPTAPLTEREIKKLLSDVSTGAALEYEGTPQNEALLWILDSYDVAVLSSKTRIIQRYALATLYFSTSGDEWEINEKWLTEDHECTWYSDAANPCDISGKVIRLELSANGIKGKLPEEVGLLSPLESMDFSSNSLSRQLPVSLWRLDSLRSLILHDNELSGDLPTSIGELSSLNTLSLYMNQFSGPIPSAIGLCTSLNRLLLSSNQFAGTIPAEIRGLTRLIQLELDSNTFTGSIPMEVFANLLDLERLFLNDNVFTSQALPVEIGGLTQLKNVRMERCGFTGSMPSQIGILKNLQTLSVRGNAFSGTIPTEVGAATNLKWFDISLNSFNGTIPTELGSLRQLEGLIASNNDLTGEIPRELASIISFQAEFDFRGNSLTGSVPEELCVQSCCVEGTVEVDILEVGGCDPDSVCLMCTGEGSTVIEAALNQPPAKASNP